MLHSKTILSSPHPNGATANWLLGHHGLYVPANAVIEQPPHSGWDDVQAYFDDEHSDVAEPLSQVLQTEQSQQQNTKNKEIRPVDALIPLISALLQEMKGIKGFIEEFISKKAENLYLTTPAVIHSKLFNMAALQNINHLCVEKKGISYRARIPKEHRELFGGSSEIKIRLPQLLRDTDYATLVRLIDTELEEAVHVRQTQRCSEKFDSKVVRQIRINGVSALQELSRPRAIKALLSKRQTHRTLCAHDIDLVVSRFKDEQLHILQSQMLSGEITEDRIDDLQSSINQKLNSARRAVVTGRLDTIEQVMREALSSIGLSIETSAPEQVVDLKKRLLPAFVEVLSKQNSMLNGDITQHHVAPKPLIDRELLVSYMLEQWSNDSCDTKTEKSCGEGQRAVDFWVKFCEKEFGRELMITECDRKIANKFIANFRASTPGPGRKLYAAATIRKSIGLISAVINHGIMESGETYVNPFAMQTKKIKVEKSRENFEIEQLEKIFSSPEFADLLEDTEVGGRYTFLVSLLALTTGARLSELTQLRCEDVQFDGDDLFIKIKNVSYADENVKQKTKTGQSRESLILPIAKATPLWTFLKNRKLNPTGALFPELMGLERPSAGISKKFARLLDKLGLVERRFVFHSFRHTFIEFARRVSEPRIVNRDALEAQVGHERKGESANDYGTGTFPRGVLRTEMKMVHFGEFDLADALRRGKASLDESKLKAASSGTRKPKAASLPDHKSK